MSRNWNKVNGIDYLTPAAMLKLANGGTVSSRRKYSKIAGKSFKDKRTGDIWRIHDKSRLGSSYSMWSDDNVTGRWTSRYKLRKYYEEV